MPSNNELFFSFPGPPSNLRNFQSVYSDNKNMLDLEPKLLHARDHRYGILF